MAACLQVVELSQHFDVLGRHVKKQADFLLRRIQQAVGAILRLCVCLICSFLSFVIASVRHMIICVSASAPCVRDWSFVGCIVPGLQSELSFSALAEGERLFKDGTPSKALLVNDLGVTEQQAEALFSLR